MAKEAKEAKKAAKEGSSEQEQIGFHKGALSTLVKERQEMMKILQIVEQLMQMHLSALKELGVDLAREAEQLQKEAAEIKKKEKKPIEEMLQ